MLSENATSERARDERRDGSALQPAAILLLDDDAALQLPGAARASHVSLWLCTVRAAGRRS